MKNLRPIMCAIIVGIILAPSASARRISGSPGSFLKTLLVQLGSGQYGRAWDTMMPAQQRLVTRDRYIDCASRDAPSFNVKTLKVIETYHERIAIPGTGVRAMTTAVTYRLTVAANGKTGSWPRTSHLVMVGGKWRWMLDHPESCG